MIAEELARAECKQDLLQRITARFAGGTPLPAEPAQQPAPSLSTAPPPRTAPAAPASGAPAPAADAGVGADGDGTRLTQRVDVKTAAMEQGANASAMRLHADAALQTKLERESRIAAGRAAEAAGDSSGT